MPSLQLSGFLGEGPHIWVGDKERDYSWGIGKWLRSWLVSGMDIGWDLWVGIGKVWVWACRSVSFAPELVGGDSL